MFIVAIISTAIVLVQNLIMFGFGLKEAAIFTFPLSFVGIPLAEIVSIWTGYFCIPLFVRSVKILALAGWVIIVLGTAELMLPASYFTTSVRQLGRAHVLNRIEQARTSLEALASDRGGSRFALTYTLKFPKTGHYLTFPAYLGPPKNRVFGDYFTKVHPEYFDENYLFDASKPYSFTVVFDAEAGQFDFSKEKASIDICDGKDYFMVCRIIDIGLEDLPATLSARPSPVLREPAVPADNPRGIAEKSIRLDTLRLKSAINKIGDPVEFTLVVTNTGNGDIPVPGDDLGNVIGVNYGWEAVTDSAKMTKVIPGIAHFGNVVAAGSAQFALLRKSSLRPGEKLEIQDKISPFEPLAPGGYRLHAYLFSRYSTETNRPVQELVEDFAVAP